MYTNKEIGRKVDKKTQHKILLEVDIVNERPGDMEPILYISCTGSTSTQYGIYLRGHEKDGAWRHGANLVYLLYRFLYAVSTVPERP
jgi:hypothetical protein